MQSQCAKPCSRVNLWLLQGGRTAGFRGCGTSCEPGHFECNNIMSISFARRSVSHRDVALITTICALLVAVCASAANPHNPIMIVPGYISSRIYVQRTDIDTDCGLVWENQTIFEARNDNGCSVQDLDLQYDPVTHTTHNLPGRKTASPPVGDVEPLMYLSDDPAMRSPLFNKIVEGLEAKAGYKRNVDLLGASYDWRKGPNELADFYMQLRDSIESLYARSGNRRVSLLSHSYGGPVTLIFLNKMSQCWKNKFIQRHINVSGVHRGSPAYLGALLFGDNSPTNLPSKQAQAMSASSPANFFMVPQPTAYPADYVLVTTPQRTYTLSQIDELLHDSGLPNANRIYADQTRVGRSQRAPNVELWCLDGYDMETTAAYNITSTHNGLVLAPNTKISGSGDGNNLDLDLTSCEIIGQGQSQPRYAKYFRGVSHTGMIRNPTVLDYIVDDILSRDLVHDTSSEVTNAACEPALNVRPLANLFESIGSLTANLHI